MNNWIGQLTSVAVGRWADLVDKLGDVLDFLVDKNAAVHGLEFGFSVLVS